jgi:excisionase family DNA binding protein
MESAMSKKDQLPPLDAKQRYTIPEAKSYLRTSHQTIYNLINAGRIATIAEGRRRYVPGSEIIRLSSVESATGHIGSSTCHGGATCLKDELIENLKTARNLV